MWNAADKVRCFGKTDLLPTEGEMKPRIGIQWDTRG